MSPILQARNLRKAFGQVEVLRGIDFSVDPQELVFVIGPSGSGKSTMLRCFNRLEEPTGGSVTVDGVAAVEVARRLAERDVVVRGGTHCAPRAHATLGTGVAVEGATGFGVGLGGGRLLPPLYERGSDLSKLGLAAAVGEKAVMANSHEPFG